jgi:predicted ATPase/DNA-binding transcriptional regulator YiaG
MMEKLSSYPKERKLLPHELLIMFRKRSLLAQVDLAQHINLKSARMLRNWEKGYSLPPSDRLSKLLEVFLKEGVFIAGREMEEAQTLWVAVKNMYDANSETFDTYPNFDRTWFEALLEQKAHSKVSNLPSKARKRETHPPMEASATYPFRPNLIFRANFNQAKTKPNNLPLPFNAFVGRQAELNSLRQKLQDNNVRLVTILGTGGSGKTRLAIEMARLINSHYKDGIWLVELAGLEDPNLVIENVASAVGFPETNRSKYLITALCDYLRSKQLLLILDNCEHLLKSCVCLVEKILEVCPNVQILTTSRQRLNLPAENILTLKGLSFPDYNPEISGDALQLLLKRAQAIEPAFRLNPENFELAVQLCLKLDGLPLAIELAASRLNSFSLAEILKRIDQTFEILDGGFATSPNRHQTLNALVDWSYNLLTEQEQQIMRYLTVFAGSWSLEVAEMIYQKCFGNSKSLSLLPFIAKLVDRSLITVVRQGQTTRYRLLEITRLTLYQKLEQEDEADLVELHSAYFWLDFCENTERHLHTGQSKELLEQLIQEQANIRKTLNWCRQQQGDNQIEEILTRISLAYAHCLLFNCHFREGWRHLNLLIERNPNQPLIYQAKLFEMANFVANQMGNFEQVEKISRAGLNYFRKIDDKERISACLNALAHTAMVKGDTDTAIRLAQESVAQLDGAPESFALATALWHYGGVMLLCIQLDEAETALTKAVTIFEPFGKSHFTAISRALLAYMAIYQDKLAVAETLLEKSLQEPLNPVSTVPTMCGSLWLAYQKEDYSVAENLANNLIQILKPVGEHWTISTVLKVLAGIKAHNRQFEDAARLFGTAQAILESMGAVSPPLFNELHQKNLDIIKANVTEADFTKYWSEGYKIYKTTGSLP